MGLPPFLVHYHAPFAEAARPALVAWPRRAAPGLQAPRVRDVVGRTPGVGKRPPASNRLAADALDVGGGLLRRGSARRGSSRLAGLRRRGGLRLAHQALLLGLFLRRALDFADHPLHLLGGLL